MEWFGVSTSSILSIERLRLPHAVMGAWMRLLALASRREADVLVGARQWTAADWDRACALTCQDLAELESAGLLSWQGEDLRVDGYDHRRAEIARGQRAGGRLGAERRWHPARDGSPNGSPNGSPTWVTHADDFGHVSDLDHVLSPDPDLLPQSAVGSGLLASSHDSPDPGLSPTTIKKYPGVTSSLPRAQRGGSRASGGSGSGSGSTRGSRSQRAAELALTAPIAADLAGELRDRIRAQTPDTVISNRHVAAWIPVLERMLRLDHRDPGEVREVIGWATAHAFWAANIRSASKLREKYEILRLQMRRPSGGGTTGTGEDERRPNGGMTAQAIYCRAMRHKAEEDAEEKTRRKEEESYEE